MSHTTEGSIKGTECSVSGPPSHWIWFDWLSAQTPVCTSFRHICTCTHTFLPILLCFIHCDTGSARLVCLCAVISSDALCPLPPPLISPSAEDTTSLVSYSASFLSASLSAWVFFLIKCSDLQLQCSLSLCFSFSIPCAFVSLPDV